MVTSRLARCVNRQATVQIGERAFRATEHIAFVRRVRRPQKRAVLGDERRLERRRARVDAEKRRAAVIGKGSAANLLGVVSRFERGVFRIVGEQRREPHDLGALHVAKTLQAREHIGQRLDASARLGPRDSAAAGHEQMRVIGDDDGVSVQFERLVEAFAQFGEVLQRTAQKRHVAANGATAREAGDGLRHDRLEDGSGDVLLLRALVEQRLHIGFREDAATAGDGIDGGMLARELVQAARIGVEERRHLVDESPRAARAGAVHALLDAVVEVDDLGVLSAKLDGHVGCGDVGLNRGLAGDDLLDEGDVEPLRKQKAARARDGDGHLLNGEFLGRLLQHLDDGGANIGMMTTVHRPLHLARRVEHGELDGGRPHVDAQTQQPARFREHGFARLKLLGGHLGLLHARHAHRARVDGGVRRNLNVFSRIGARALLRGLCGMIGFLLEHDEIPLQLDRFAGFYEQEADGDARHLLGAFLHSALEPARDDAEVGRSVEGDVVLNERSRVAAVLLVEQPEDEIGAERVAQTLPELGISPPGPSIAHRKSPCSRR